MSIHVETAGRPRTPLMQGAAALALALTLSGLTAGPLAAQTAAPLFDDPMEALLDAPREPETRPAPIPFEPAPEPRFQNRPAAPAAAVRTPATPAEPLAEAAPSAATLGFSAEPTRIDAQNLGRAGAQVGARGDEIVQGAARRWGLAPATLYMLGALLGLLGLLLLARLLGFGQNPVRETPPRRRKPAARPAARTRSGEAADDWEEQEPEEARFAVAARRASARPAARGRREPAAAAAPDGDWGEDWAEAAPSRAGASGRAPEASRAPAPRRPNLDRLAASIRETWPKGEHPEEGAVSPARAAAARVAREFAAEEPAAAASRRPSRSAPRDGDFLDALEAAGEGDPSAMDRVRALTRAR